MHKLVSYFIAKVATKLCQNFNIEIEVKSQSSVIKYGQNHMGKFIYSCKS